MADNIAVTAGSGNTIAADDVGGVLYQRVKVAHGADGAATDVSSASPLPITLTPRSLNWQTGSVGTSGDNQILAAAGANTKYVIKYLIIQNVSGTAVTTVLCDGATATMTIRTTTDGSGMAFIFDFAHEWRGSNNTAVILNLSGWNGISYTVGYWTE